jgi:hypothetical protein
MKSNMLLYIRLIMIYKRYEYWSKEGKVWSKWFPWKSDLRPELQMEDRRIISRLKNEYKDEKCLCTNC